MNDIFSNLKLLVSNQIQCDAFKTAFIQQLNKTNSWLYVDCNIVVEKVWLLIDGKAQVLDEYRIVVLDRHGKYGKSETMLTVCDYNEPDYYFMPIEPNGNWFTDMLNKATRSIKVDAFLLE